MYNENSLDTICGALAYAMGVEPPKEAAEKNAELSAFIDSAFFGEKADRVVMYNPDAIGQWIYEKYPYFCRAMEKWADVKIPLRSVMPSVKYTPRTPSVIMTFLTPISKNFFAAARHPSMPSTFTPVNCSASVSLGVM